MQLKTIYKRESSRWTLCMWTALKSTFTHYDCKPVYIGLDLTLWTPRLLINLQPVGYVNKIEILIHSELDLNYLFYLDLQKKSCQYALVRLTAIVKVASIIVRNLVARAYSNNKKLSYTVAWRPFWRPLLTGEIEAHRKLVEPISLSFAFVETVDWNLNFKRELMAVWNQSRLPFWRCTVAASGSFSLFVDIKFQNQNKQIGFLHSRDYSVNIMLTEPWCYNGNRRPTRLLPIFKTTKHFLKWWLCGTAHHNAQGRELMTEVAANTRLVYAACKRLSLSLLSMTGFTQ